MALLQCPDIADYVQGLGAHLRFEGAVPGPLRELAILMTARFWTAAYEWCAHVTIAEKEGLAPEVITAIGDKKTPEFQSAEEKAVYDFCREALEHRRVGDDAFARTKSCRRKAPNRRFRRQRGKENGLRLHLPRPASLSALY